MIIFWHHWPVDLSFSKKKKSCFFFNVFFYIIIVFAVGRMGRQNADEKKDFASDTKEWEIAMMGVGGVGKCALTLQFCMVCFCLFLFVLFICLFCFVVVLLFCLGTVLWRSIQSAVLYCLWFCLAFVVFVATLFLFHLFSLCAQFFFF